MNLGIDIGGTNIKFGFVEGKKVKKKKIIRAKKGEILSTVKDFILKNKDRFDKVGLAVAGFLKKNGEVVFSPNVRELDGTNFKEELGDVGKEIHVINDVNAMALCELKYGYGKNFRNFVVIAIGTGVGGAIVLDRKLYLGSTGFAGEIGHAVVDINGRTCKCGRKGCLETFLGRKYILELSKNIIDRSSLLYGKDYDVVDIYREAKKGDKCALRVFDIVARYLAVGIVNVFNILDIDGVVLSGGISNEILLRCLRMHLKDEKIVPKNLEVRISRFRNNAGIIGASIYADMRNKSLKSLDNLSFL